MALFSPGCRGKLWLGGEAAASNLSILRANKITVLFPAASKPCQAQSMDLRSLAVMDGTGVANGEVSFDKLMKTVDQAVEALVAGKSVLIYCRNGAHRSATLSALTLMRLLTLGADPIHTHLNAARNIVDLESRAPPNKYRAVSRMPLEYLREVFDRVQGLEALAGLTRLDKANDILTPIGFRRRCLQLGFQTTRDAGFQPASGLGSAAPSEGEQSQASQASQAPQGGVGEARPRKKLLVAAAGDSSGVESFEMISSGDEDMSDGGYVNLQPELESDADIYSIVQDELEDPEARREKIRKLMQDLQLLDAKLMGVQAESVPHEAPGAGTTALGAGDTVVEEEEDARMEDTDKMEEEEEGWESPKALSLSLQP